MSLQSPSSTATFTHDSWEAIARTLHSMCACDVVVERDLAAALRARTVRTTSLSVHDILPSVYNKSVATQAIYRGPDSADAYEASDSLLRNPKLYCEFNTTPYQCCTSPRPAFGYSRVGAIARYCVKCYCQLQFRAISFVNDGSCDALATRTQYSPH